MTSLALYVLAQVSINEERQEMRLSQYHGNEERLFTQNKEYKIIK